jgi:hypothetical protein
MTLAISGTGHAGMEAAVANAVEPGDIMIVGVNGLWGERVGDLAARYGADVRLIHAPAGEVFNIKQLEAAFDANPGAKVLFLTHGESSTGTLQPVEGVGALCKARGALFLLDTVCTLGGVPLEVDKSGVDLVRLRALRVWRLSHVRGQRALMRACRASRASDVFRQPEVPRRAAGRVAVQHVAARPRQARVAQDQGCVVLL